MTPSRARMVRMATAAVLAMVASSFVQAVPILINGGFESGFSGWTRVNQLGSEGTFLLQTGTTSPVNADPVPAPPEGTSAAMTDAFGPGSHVLYQDFLATAGSASLSFAVFVGNRDTDFFVPPALVGLDFSTPALNQQARVDIIRVAADPFSVGAADVLLNLYQTLPGAPLVSGYNTVSLDVTAFLAAHTGESLRIRFAETDNVGPFQFGVDNVRFTAATAVPEPSLPLLLGLGFAALALTRSRCRGTARC